MIPRPGLNPAALPFTPSAQEFAQSFSSDPPRRPSPPGLDGLALRGASEPNERRALSMTALARAQAKGKAPMASGASSSATVETHPESAAIAQVLQQVDALMALGQQHQDLQQDAPSLDTQIRMAAVSAPFDAAIARLTHTVEDLQRKKEDRSRAVNQHRAELEKYEATQVKLERALHGLTASACVSDDAPRSDSVGQASTRERQPIEWLSENAVNQPAASPLAQAQQQRDQARSRQEAAHAAFKRAKERFTQRRDEALEHASKLRRAAAAATSSWGRRTHLCHKIALNCANSLGVLGLAAPQGEKKAELAREFKAYCERLVQTAPDGQRRFHEDVKPGLQKLMALDVLIRTMSTAPFKPLAVIAWDRYKDAHPGEVDPSGAEVKAMAELALQKTLEGFEMMTRTTTAACALPRRRRVDGRYGTPADTVTLPKGLRVKDMRNNVEPPRLLTTLLEANREELQHTLAAFIRQSLADSGDEQARCLEEAEQATARASQPDPELQLRMVEVAQARKAFQQAEIDVARRSEAQRTLKSPPGPAVAVPVEPEVASVPMPWGSEQALRPDPEIRLTKLRGQRLDNAAACRDAQRDLDEASTAAQSANRAWQAAQRELDTALANRDRMREATRQDRAHTQEIRHAHGEQLTRLSAEICDRRTELSGSPALRRLVLPLALDRLIKVHVLPEDEEVRRRAVEETHLNGRYDSVEHMAQAVVQVHAGAFKRFPTVFEARTLREFERAAQAYQAYNPETKTLLRVTHDHAHRVGQGYDSHPDRTQRLMPLTQSEYCLGWQKDEHGVGRVVISHLHPSVPKRMLKTLSE